jgi:hypothetical protein
MTAEKLDDLCLHPVVERIIQIKGEVNTYTVYHCLLFFGGCNRIWRDKTEDLDTGIDLALRQYAQVQERHLFILKHFDREPYIQLVK